ncbi:MAG: hypothetical protein ACI857_001615 [Arenicella sp.]|jgi:hypothetical protein
MSSYKFRVLIDNQGSEEVFRDIYISATENFETFYRAILAAFDFSGLELASFYVSNNSWDKGHEIALMDMELSDSLSSPSIMKETLIQDLVTASDQKFVMVYDFLKMWCFMIELNEVSEEEFEGPMLDFSVGEAPLETSREVDLSGDSHMSTSMDLGNEIDDIFSDSNEDDFGGFENIDDFDI